MERRGYELQYRDLWKDPLSVAELEKLIGPRDHSDFLNTHSEAYREKNLAENPPTRREAVRMAKEPRLIRRPVIVAGGRVVLGFDEKGMARF